MPRQVKRRVENNDCHGKASVAAGGSADFNEAEQEVIMTANPPPPPVVDVSTWGDAATDAYWTDGTSPAFGKFVSFVSNKVVAQQPRKDQLANVLSMNRMRETMGEAARQEWVSRVMRNANWASLNNDEKRALFDLLMQNPEHVPKTLGSLSGTPGKSPFQMSSQ